MSFLSLPSSRWLAAASLGLGLCLCLLPLTGIHGAESALALGLTLSPLAGALGARVALSRLSRGAPGGPLSHLRHAVLAGLWLWLWPTLALALNALRVKNCAPLEGLGFMVLGPGCSAALSALCGAAFALSGCGPRLATAFGVLTPVGAILVGLWRFYATPAIFAYGHFYGYFAGTLYDELLSLPMSLWVLRLLTLLLAVGISALLVAHFDPEKARVRLRPQPNRHGLSLFAGCCLLTFLSSVVYAPRLGHAASADLIAERLGQRVVSRRCELILPRELTRARADRLAHDCDLRVEQAEHFLGLAQPTPIRVYLFRNAGEKQVLMGASGTNIAKPWLGEVYLHDRGFPHPVLAHEIAHVVAAHTGVGPFRVSGALGGLWPDPALIEGLAVAAAWADSSGAGMTPHQWSRAMLELDMAPPLSEVLGVGFFKTQKSMAYTLAGSFLRHVADTRGREALRRIYRHGDIESALGEDIASLDRGWRAFLRGIPLPEPARALAQVRFAGGSILSRVCPHQVASLRSELGGDLTAGNDAAAADTCARILELDPDHTDTRATLAAVLARIGDAAGARGQLAALEGPPSAAPLILARVRHSLADEAWRAGRTGEALAAYRALLEEPASEQARRLLQVKRLALEGTPRAARLLFDLLIGEPGLRADGATAVYLTRELRRERDDGLPQYLESRQLLFQERFAPAATLVAEARGLGLPTAEIEREALRVEAIARFGAGELERSAALWRRQRDRGDPAAAAEALDWLARIRHARARR